MRVRDRERNANCIGEANYRGVSLEEVLEARVENGDGAGLSQRGGREARSMD